MALVDFTQGDEPTISVLTDLDYSTSAATAFRFTKSDGSQIEITTNITHDGVQGDGRFKSNIRLETADSLLFRAGPTQDFAITGTFSGMPLTSTAVGQLNVRPLDLSAAEEAGFIC